MKGEKGSIDFLGFLKTSDGHTHLLLNFGYPGTSTAYPVLHVFDVHGIEVKELGEFYGFYLYAIPNRLRDLDCDGNTEIISVGETYWPPGASHAEVEVELDIYEYREGRYVKANSKHGILFLSEP